MQINFSKIVVIKLYDTICCTEKKDLTLDNRAVLFYNLSDNRICQGGADVIG